MTSKLSDGTTKKIYMRMVFSTNKGILTRPLARARLAVSIIEVAQLGKFPNYPLGPSCFCLPISFPRNT